MRDALRDAGLAGRTRARCERGRHIGYLEAHIEQGETLKAAISRLASSRPLSGSGNTASFLRAKQNHAGTTRMAIRRDAGLALARFCVAIDERFPPPAATQRCGPPAASPSIPVREHHPGAAEMLFQIRDDDPAVIARLEDLLRSMAAEVDKQGRCSVAVERIRTGAPALMDASFQQAIEQAGAACAGGKSAPYAERRRSRRPGSRDRSCRQPCCFVPSIGGISHHWTENTADADIITGRSLCRRVPAAFGGGETDGRHGRWHQADLFESGIFQRAYGSSVSSRCLMDVSSEMIHALLPITWLRCSRIDGDGRNHRRHRGGDRLHYKDILRRAFGPAGQAQMARGGRLRSRGLSPSRCFPLAPTIAWLVAARFVDRIGKGIRGAPRDALVADLSPADLRGASFGLRQSLDTIGAFMGPCSRSP